MRVDGDGGRQGVVKCVVPHSVPMGVGGRAPVPLLPVRK